MARKVLTEVKQEQQVEAKNTSTAGKLKKRLEKLIPVYGQNKIRADELKAAMDDDKAEIKRICEELSIEKLADVDGWKMIYKVKEKHVVDEDRMLAIIKEYWSKNGSMQCPYIKRVECINPEALETAIFNGDIMIRRSC